MVDKPGNQQESEPKASNRTVAGPKNPKSGKKKKNPGKTPAEMLELRVEEVRQLLVACKHKGEIKRFLYKKYRVSVRTAENYLARARAQLIAEQGEPKEFKRGQSLARYEEIAADPKAKASVRLQAQKQLDRLLGLQVPVPILHANADGEPLELSAPAEPSITNNFQLNQVNLEGLTTDQIRQIRDARQQLRDATAKITLNPPAENVGASE